jgi:hypothetical protein
MDSVLIQARFRWLIKNTSSLLLFVCSIDAIASNFDSRYEKWEVFLAPQFTNSKLLQFDNGAEADINERSGLGFGFGYNVNHHIELSLLFSSSNGNYTGTRIADDGADTPERFTANMYTSKLDFGFTYNLFRSAFTPYVSANIGSTYIDSGIPTGNIGSVCWWDPWWGYICGPYSQTYTSTELNYGAGAGLRYDFNRKVYIKGGVAKNYIEIDSTNTPDFTSYQVYIGIMF